MSRDSRVCSAKDLPPGARRIIEVGGREIGVFNVNGRYYALRNICPHQGAPLCLGEVDGTLLPSRPGEYVPGREGEIIRCPWHAWEFDLVSGKSLFDARIRVKTFEVVLRNGDVYVRA